MTFDYNDAPISSPEEDAFGINDFAKALANSLFALKSPRGSVVSLNGVWGSGKSSAGNLILHHLAEVDAAEEVKVVRFECWWFRGEEALALAFFRELHAALGPSLKKKAKQAISKIGSRLLKVSPVAGPLIDLATAGAAGTITTGALQSLVGLIEDDQNVEALHRELAAALAKQDRRFLIVIDDIDRLSPDEMLLIFRLVKSVGRLPQVMYLMVYDRTLAEKTVAEQYPTEGPHFLEKIVQASFELPPPGDAELRSQALSAISEICAPAESELVEILNAFYDVVAPLLRTPRDVKRLAYNLSVTWPSIRDEVAIGDFVAIECLRLFRQPIYTSIKLRKEMLCGSGAISWNRRMDELVKEYDVAFLGGLSDDETQYARKVLKRLFPRTQGIWGNVHHSSDNEWRRDRRVCASEHFDTYFRFSIGDKTLPKAQIDNLIANATNPNVIADALSAAAKEKLRSGGTQAALILDELNVHADQIADSAVAPLLEGVFRVVDEIDVQEDQAKAFEIGNNPLRVHWLLRRLTLERFDLAKRSSIFVNACKSASLKWLIDFADSAYRDYHPRESKEPAQENRCLTTAQDADHLWKQALGEVIKASKSGALIRAKGLPYLLYGWREMAGDDGASVRNWSSGALKRTEDVLALMRAFTSYTWSQSMGFDGMGDRVARRHLRAGVSSIDEVLDKKRFRRALELLARDVSRAEAERDEIREFLASWDRVDSGKQR